MKLFSVFVNVILLSACAAINEQSYYYNEIVLRNNLPGAVTDVRIKVEKIQGIFSCSYIISGTACSTKFSKRKYQGNSIQVSWTYLNRKKISEPFIVSIPKGLDKDVPLRGVIEVTQKGMINAYFESGKD